MSAPRRRPPGRPAGSTGTTRDAVLGAARAMFAERGYDGASLRAIAAAAGVDPGMVRHFFGDKEGLFRAVVHFPVDPAQVVARLFEGATEGIGERLVRFFLSTWEGGAGPSPFVTLLRSAVSREDAAALLSEYVTHALLSRLVARLDRPNPELRATLAASHLVGVGFARHVLRIEPLASADHDTLVRAIGPTIQRYLTGDIGLG